MDPLVDRLFSAARDLCLAKEDAFEKASHGSPAFFIRNGGQFAALWDNHHNDGNTALLLALPFGAQESLIDLDPAVFYRPPYYGPSGWVGIRLDKVQDWALIEILVDQAHRYIATKPRRARKSAGAGAKLGAESPEGR